MNDEVREAINLSTSAILDSRQSYVELMSNAATIIDILLSRLDECEMVMENFCNSYEHFNGMPGEIGEAVYKRFSNFLEREVKE